MGEKIDITLEELRQLHGRIGRQALEPRDFPVVGALVSSFMGKYEARMTRLRVKAAAAAAAAVAGQDDKVIDVDHRVIGDDAKGGGSIATPSEAPAGAEGSGPAAGGAPPPAAEGDQAGDKPKAPGHGRNGAAAYTAAKHFSHLLAGGVLGSVCTCGTGRLCSYRETTTIRIVGQPLFASEAHHYQQARCKMCGRVVIAPGPEHVQQGIGKSVVYAYSACAMLIVMHYFGGAPFKRLESLHESWGTPLADANLWVVAEASDGLLRPLFNAMERVGMQRATNLGIDDTGAMVISIMRQIKAEIAALAKLGESTDDVRNGINATGARLETPDGIVILYATGPITPEKSLTA